MATITIELPEDVVAEIGEARVRSLAREALIVRLYDLGEISGERAVEVLGVTRYEFLELLDSYGVTVYDEGMGDGEDEAEGE